MAARHVLLLDANRLTVLRWQDGQIDTAASFIASEQGCTEFSGYLANHRDSLFYMLADVGDEGFLVEDVPYQRGADRKAIIQRKLAQHFRGTPLSLALSQGRQAAGRRDERLLFAALTRWPHFEPWLQALQQAEAPLVGVYSLPLVASMLGAACKAPRCLLITLTAAGLRQTCFVRGHLQFSRLTALTTGTLEEAAQACHAEATKIRHYLIDGQPLAGDAKLAVQILAHPDEIGIFRRHCANSTELEFSYIDLPAAARRRGCVTPLHNSRSEALFAHLLIHHPPRLQFAAGRARRFFHLRRLRRALNAWGTVFLLACLPFVGITLHEFHQLKESTAALRLRSADDAAQYQALLQAQPSLPQPLSLASLRTLIEQHEMLRRHTSSPTALYQHLGHALANLPEITLERLNWAVALQAAAAARPGSPVAVLEMHAALPAGTAHQAQSQASLINTLVERLRTGPEIQVDILDQAFDASPGKSLKSTDPAITEAPRFTLRITQRL